MESLVQDRTSFCETCIKEGRGRIMSESEARIHRDNEPTHNIVVANEEVIGE